MVKKLTNLDVLLVDILDEPLDGNVGLGWLTEKSFIGRALGAECYIRRTTRIRIYLGGECIKNWIDEVVPV